MSRQQIHWNTREHDQLHQQKLLAKIQKIEGLKALLEMWEQRPDQVEHSYLLKLRARLRSAENQLNAMKP
jgi:hypothetical protein